jgi:glycerol kinase
LKRKFSMPVPRGKWPPHVAPVACPEPEALLEKWQPERRFAPQMPANEREERYAGWRRAVAGVLETVS